MNVVRFIVFLVYIGLVAAPPGRASERPNVFPCSLEDAGGAGPSVKPGVHLDVLGPPANRDPGPVVVDREGDIWFGESGRLAELKANGDYIERSVRDGGYVDGIAVDGKGSIWFTQAKTNRVGYLSTNMTTTLYTAPAQLYPTIIGVARTGDVWVGGIGGIATWSPGLGFRPFDTRDQGITALAVAQDGSIWFAQGGAVITHSLRGGATKRRSVGDPGTQIQSLAIDNSGILWFTDAGHNQIGDMLPSAEGKVKRLTLSGAPDDLAVSPTGDIWFSEPSAFKIGRVSAKEGLKEYNLGVGLSDLVVTDGGTVWATGSPNTLVSIGSNGNIEYYSTFGGRSCGLRR